MHSTLHLPEALVRIQAEFVEMPGLKLTARQVQRLCGLQRDCCETALATLVRLRVLVQAADGAYLRERPVAQARHLARGSSAA